TGCLKFGVHSNRGKSSPESRNSPSMPSRLTSPHYRHTKGRIAKGRGSEGETTRKQLTACASACAAPPCGVAVNALTSPWRFMIALFFGHSEGARWRSKPQRFPCFAGPIDAGNVGCGRDVGADVARAVRCADWAAMCDLNSTLRTGLARLHLSDTDWYPIGGFEIAVGTTIADCPPHGPGRALLSASG